MRVERVPRLPRKKRVGFVFKMEMILHHNYNKNRDHPERKRRILAIYYMLCKTGLLDEFDLIDFKPADLDDILRVHSRKIMDAL